MRLDIGLPVIARVIVVYDSPSDFPGMFVTRVWHVLAGVPHPVPDPCCYEFDTLELAREYVATTWPEFRYLQRMPGDDPSIVELYG